MRIAIVDDNVRERNELDKRIKILLSRSALNAETVEFGGGKEFIAEAKQNNFEVVFLDIYMEDENGVEVAKELRSFVRNCILVFTTTSTDHALDGFKVRALQYLVKPYADEELNAVFKEIIEKIPTPDKYIDVNVVGGDVRIRLCEIIFAEHFQHCIHIHTSDGQTTITRKTFSGFMIELEGDERFFMCSRGVLINLEYAKDFNGSVFTLKNGTEIPVSRSLAKSARVAFGDFLFRRGQNNA